MNGKRNKQIGIGAALFSVVVACLFIFMKGENASPAAVAVQQPPVNIIQGLKSGTSVEFTFLSKDGSFYKKDIASAGHPLIFEQDGKTGRAADQYEFSYKIVEEGQAPENVRFRINRASGFARMEAGGFGRETQLSLLANDKPVHTEVPVDWAGRMTLDAQIKKGTLCLVLPRSALSFCHDISGGKEA
ncbi:MAG: hypothetical protein H6853_01195 [Rhodospirillales bacterium]|nr:hypothetical protein [Alphaproteobacteria bacterium]USO03927.1 MAG: hypothetical protein H6853_01195 [Rhodospirillales bacterium]